MRSHDYPSAVRRSARRTVCGILRGDDRGRVNPKKLFSGQELPTLAPALAHVGLTLVDVGGRGDAVPELVALAPFAHHVVCEPDAQEAERLAEQLRGSPWRRATVIREALAAAEGQATLFLTREPGLSSLLRPRADTVARLPFADRFEVASTVNVPTLPLDAAAAKYDFTDACFLKLDTQGTELDILRSGARLLPSILGVMVEVSFREWYEGQALAHHVGEFLHGHGFELFSLSRTNLRRRGFRPETFSRRVTTWAHALYFREPAALLTGGLETQRAQVVRLVGLALAFQFIDTAFEAADVASRIGAVEDGNGLHADVERCADAITRYRLHGVTEAERRERLAASFKDKRQRE
jgi:FkbM family methyltransferase